MPGLPLPQAHHRPYQKLALGVQTKRRVMGFYWARRCRKSTTAGDIYFQELSTGSGRTVVHCSASLLLGRESIGMTLSAVERGKLLATEATAVRDAFAANARARGLAFKVANRATGRVYRDRLSPGDLTELYEARALELRLYFNATQYSRELILAPSVQTFRSYRALVGLDEFGYLPAELARDLVNSADAMMRDTPDRRLLFFSNLSLGDHHPWYEMTLPRQWEDGGEDAAFPPHPQGHLYTGQTGRLIHRVNLADAYAAGHLLYDDRGRPMSYEQCRCFPSLRGGWDISYALNHQPGGACVIDLAALAVAQRRGSGQCYFVPVDTDAAFQRALNLLRACLRDGAVGLGFDVATTTADVSNPSSVTVREKSGGARYDRLKLIWKERQPQVARDRLTRLIQLIRNRPAGGPARRLCVDASNERYFARETADHLAALIPVQLVVAGQAVDPPPPGYTALDGRINYKTWLGDLEVANVNEGRLALPPDDYLKADYRLIMKDGGRFLCVPDAASGAHGDTFDSGKLAELALLAGNPGKIFQPAGPRAQSGRTRRQRSVIM